jgi:hypothetical protein
MVDFSHHSSPLFLRHTPFKFLVATFYHSHPPNHQDSNAATSELSTRHTRRLGDGAPTKASGNIEHGSNSGSETAGGQSFRSLWSFRRAWNSLRPPDYTTSMGQVFLEFTCELIRWHECLEILMEASSPGILGMPTWVPDWSRHHHRVFKGYSRAAGDSSPSFDIVRSDYDITKDSDSRRDDF